MRLDDVATPRLQLRGVLGRRGDEHLLLAVALPQVPAPDLGVLLVVGQPLAVGVHDHGGDLLLAAAVPDDPQVALDGHDPRPPHRLEAARGDAARGQHPDRQPRRQRRHPAHARP
ncbi:hypothetical protein [Ornithinimicrobium kibberense]|uniref:hypothetical protein n=1 Tax=Ornithinimicrobium kibberense TaxID=282060 RepID=UPI0036092D12